MRDPLDEVALPRTGLPIRRLALGTAPLASLFWGNDTATAVQTAARALELGIRFFDTAPFYGLGESERRLGRALAGAGDQRPVIATKAGRILTVQPDGSVDVHFDFGYDAAVRSLDSSLERLGVDRVDIVHIHDPDDHIHEALEGTYPALAELRDQGVIGAVSVGTNSVGTAAAFLERADLDCMLVAGRYTLLDRSAADLIDACAGRGIAYLSAGVFNSGVLARPRAGSWYDYGPAPDAMLARAAALDSVCRRHGVTLRAAAVNFPLTNPAVASVIVGMAAPAEVDENLAALRTPVPDDLWLEMEGMELEG